MEHIHAGLNKPTMMATDSEVCMNIVPSLLANQRPSSSKLKIAGLCLLCFVALPAIQVPPSFAQLRAGQPETLVPPPRGTNPDALASMEFRLAYQQAGAPRIVVLWNRSFGDEISSEYEEIVVHDSVRDGSFDETERVRYRPNQTKRKLERDATEHRKTSEMAGTKRVKTQRAETVGLAARWEVEQAFLETLSSAGVSIIDRDMALRMTAMPLGVGERANVQELEAQALAQNAEILIEVLPSSASAPDSGMTYRITARDLKSSRILATFAGSGRPSATRMPLVAGEYGFERAQAREPSIAAIGNQLALNLMKKMAAGWR